MYQIPLLFYQAKQDNQIKMGLTQRDIEIRMKRQEDAIEHFEKTIPELDTSLKEIEEQLENLRVNKEEMLSFRKGMETELKKRKSFVFSLGKTLAKLMEQEAYNNKYEPYVERCIEYLGDVSIINMTSDEIIAKAQEKHFNHLLNENDIILGDDDEYEGYYVIGDVFDCLERTDDDDGFSYCHIIDFGCCHKRFGYAIESEVVENISEYGEYGGDFSIDSKIDDIYEWKRIC